MASKRKSTVPCMIPRKILRPAEDVEQDLVLRDQPKFSGRGQQSPVDPREPDADVDCAGTYTCKPCHFETHDLNLFLDHVYSGHPDFRTEPRFLCVSCGVSALKFEGLALHNARVHPSTLDTTLQLRRKDKKVVVEQNLVSRADSGKDTEITITKTPIMRMLKGKSEPKRISVSHLTPKESSTEPHSLSSARDVDKKEPAAVTMTNISTIVHNGVTKTTLPSAVQIVNGSGALPVLKNPITQVVSVVQSKTPITASSSSHLSSENLPKVMIPLSSIPTYSASMDSSSFLKTSFNKFPYPTKAELCYLTVVTRFPEEQIKIWFTAQRLKQGISWSPEEIEEARRKMFNTIIQTAPRGAQSQSHGSSHPTITVVPASLGATGIPHILQGSLVSQGGVIVTQPLMANGIQVNGTPMALAVTPKPQAASRPTMQARPVAALAADKGVSTVVGAVGSISSTGSGGVSNCKGSRSGGGSENGQGSAINLSLGSSGPSNAKVSSVSARTKQADVSDESKSNASNIKSSDVSVEQSDGSKTTGCKNDEDAKSNRTNTSTDDIDPNSSDSFSFKMDDAPSPGSKSSSPSPSASQSGAFASRTPVNAFLDPSFFKSKKSHEQLSTLKDSFLLNQFPDQEEVERLTTLTGLTVREVRKWFSDRRYHFRHQKGLRMGAGPLSLKSGVTAGTGSGSSTPGSGGAGSADPSESVGGRNSGAKTPQHSSAALSPTATQTPTSPTTPSRRQPRVPSPDFTAVRYKEREPHQVRALESSFALDPDPCGEEVDRLRSETKMTRREVNGWFAERRKKVAAEKKRGAVIRSTREEEEHTEVDGEERQKEDASGEMKVNPIKINLKMLKVTEAGGKAEAEGSETPDPAPSSNPKPPKPSQSPKPSTTRGKKTAEQLHQLKQVYARTQWPTAAQYDDLLSTTGLSRPEVVRWFGDCRYVQKNGQLKWLVDYQATALQEDLPPENEPVLRSHLDLHGRLQEAQLQDLAQTSGLTADLVRHWFTNRRTKGVAAHAKPPEPAAPTPKVPESEVPSVKSPEPLETSRTSSEPVVAAAEPSPEESQTEGGRVEVMEQPVSSLEAGAVDSSQGCD